MHNVSLDPGFGAFKGAFFTNGSPVQTTIPAVVGPGLIQNHSLAVGFARRRKVAKPMQVHFDSLDYLVGPNVHRYTVPSERLDYGRLSNGPELRSLTYATLAALLGAGEHTINLMLALPVAVLDDAELSRPMMATLRKWMIDTHEFTVNGEPIKIVIEQVKAHAQPLGSLFAWGMSEKGKWIASTSPYAHYGVGDIGLNTLDCYAIKDADVIDVQTGGDTRGTRKAIQFIIDEIDRQYDRGLTFYEADELLRMSHPMLEHSSGIIDLSDMIRQATDSLFGQVGNYLSGKFGNGNQFSQLIFTGGGAELLKAQLLEMYPAATVLGQADNALGLAKYIQRKGAFK